MNFMGRVMSGFGGAVRGFRDNFLNADPQGDAIRSYFDEYSRWDVRKTRYDLYWSMYQNNTFDDMGRGWEDTLKIGRSLYKAIRSVHSVGYRLGQFWGSHVFAGVLDPAAGDGETIRTAIPIVSASDPVRAAIAKVWRDSRFHTFKDVIPLYGATLGDCGLIAVDDPDREQVRLEVVHPGKVRWIERDERGRTTGYMLEYPRYEPLSDKVAYIDPDNPRFCTYREKAKLRSDGTVLYETWKDNSPFDWRGLGSMSSSWEADYGGIVPFWVFNHNPTTLPWGISEFQPLFSKELEINDARSLLGDQIRKAVKAPFMLSGVRPPSTTPRAEGATPSRSNDPHPERNESHFLYADLGSTATPLVFPVDIPGVNGHTGKIHDEIVEDYPELQVYILSDGRTSGKAVRESRRAAEIKVQTRRPAYDETLVMAQSAAAFIGAIRGYPGFEGVPTADFDDPGLQHQIAHRPVFQPDPLDDVEQATAFWTMAQTATAAGAPLELILRREGWPEAEIAEVTKFREQQHEQAMEAKAKAQTNVGTVGGNKTEGQKAQD